VSERRILRDDPTDAERELLDSARMDVPPAASRGRTLAALGLALAATTTASAGAAATSGAVAIGVVKWVVLSAIGGAIALGTVEGLSPPAHRADPAFAAPAVRARLANELRLLRPPIAPAPSAPPVSSAEPVEQPPAVEEPATVEQPPAVEASAPIASLDPPPPEAPPAPALRPVATPPPVALAAELSRLDEARRAIASGDASKSLELLDSFDREVAHPALGPEASLIRIEALIALGRVDGARRIGERLLSAQPNGAYSQRVRSLLESSQLHNP
jgi:hypothetical protein